VTDASGAYLRFQGPKSAVWHRRVACHMKSHSITCHPTQANPFLLYIWEKSQTSAYYCPNLPNSEAGTNLYCLVNRSTCVWTTCPRSLPGSAPAQSQTSGLQFRHATVTYDQDTLNGIAPLQPVSVFKRTHTVTQTAGKHCKVSNKAVYWTCVMVLPPENQKL